MTRGIVAASLAFVIACGARSEIAGSDIEEDAGADATLDGGHDADASHADAPFDAHEDAPFDAPIEACCDLGVKQSGCQTCSAGETCIDKVGSCVHDTPQCGPSNCKGCCFGTKICGDGTEIGACGNGGQFCQTCFDSKNKFLACVPNEGGGGTCKGGPTCNPQNCGQGCCNGNVCMVGDLDTLCGAGGMACADCSSLGGTCEGNACKLPHQ